MPSYDSIVVGEDWISEHYFTTDSTKESFQGKVVELRKQWDDEVAEVRDTVRGELISALGEIQTTLSVLSENPEGVSAANELVRTALGFPDPLDDYVGERAGTELRLPKAQPAGVTSTLFLQAAAVTSIDDLLDPEIGLLLEPGLADNKPIPSASKAVSAAFRADEPPAFVLVQAGQWLLLAEAERWAEGRYLAVDLLVVAERRDDKRGGEIDRVVAMLSRQALLPDADGNIWWTGVLEDSVKHTVGVSKDLREGIRLSIEIIANDVVRRREERGLPLEQIDAQQLAKQSLRFLYRILFLLYAEASPEMRVLPSGAPEYGEGYGLDRLRELTLTELVSPQAKSGTHLYESLATLFRLVDQGHAPKGPTVDDVDDPAPGLEFNALRADLFAPAATALIDEVGLGNEATQRVLQHLLLSKGRKGADRGFISYAELGINQLGAVYEGLMSFTGFFATEDLYEVAKNGDPEKGSWVVPVTDAGHLSKSDFVTTLDEATGEQVPVIHRERTFVYRLAGRERQQSASYYTPEVLTKFVVSQALEELLDQDGGRTTPEQILQLTICEPALGSGAFAIEAVRQLAAEYLKRKQEDLGKVIDADQYQVELQKVKAYLALHQVYGVDLNATAVELAEISLWLDTMVAGLQAPWFGLHLRRGNSLIGARRAVYAPSLLAKKAWLSTAPEDKPLGEEIGAGIHHFLLPSQGWGAVIDTPEAKAYAQGKREELRLWRTGIRGNASAAIKKRLAALAERVETLWEFTLRRLTIAESEIRRDIDIWGQQLVERSEVAVTREQIETVLHDENGAYRRLRRVMDAWCALWSWPLTTDVEPPDWDQWVGGLEAILGVPPKAGKFEKYGQTSLANQLDWDELDMAEENDRVFSQTQPIHKALESFPWLTVTHSIAQAQGFFHWELDFAPVFGRGGFDLQVGNPPWVRPDWDEAAVLSEFDPWWQLSDGRTPEAEKAKRAAILEDHRATSSFLDERAFQFGMSCHLKSDVDRPVLKGIRPDLYRCFMERTWTYAAPEGVVGLIHPDGHFTDPDAGHLRGQCYLRLRRHWHFINKLKLFEVDGSVEFAVQVYGPKSEPNFKQAVNIFHPYVILRSMAHDGSGSVTTGIEARSEWKQLPHRERISSVTADELIAWSNLLDDSDARPLESRMLYISNRASASALGKMSSPLRLADVPFSFTNGLNQKTDVQNGSISEEFHSPTSWEDVILRGWQIATGLPLAKQPNVVNDVPKQLPLIDLESIQDDFVPSVSYSRAMPMDDYRRKYPSWGSKPSSDYFRIMFRSMGQPKNERILQAAIAPPGPSHVNSIHSITMPELDAMVIMAGIMHSLIADFQMRSINATNLHKTVIARLPFMQDRKLKSQLLVRTLRLNCLVRQYSGLWDALFDNSWEMDSWVPHIGVDFVDRHPLGAIGPKWEWSTPLRRAADRRQALVEIDAIVAIMLGITAEELQTIYRTQFPVLQRYERDALYDANGQQLPGKLASEYRKSKVKPADLTVDGVTYVEPFVGVDRGRDMELAHKHFSDLVQL